MYGVRGLPANGGGSGSGVTFLRSQQNQMHQWYSNSTRGKFDREHTREAEIDGNRDRVGSWSRDSWVSACSSDSNEKLLVWCLKLRGRRAG